MSLVGRVADGPFVADKYQTEFHLDHLKLADSLGPIAGKLLIDWSIDD